MNGNLGLMKKISKYLNIRRIQMGNIILKPGDVAPDFCLPNQDGEEICLESLRGKWVVLYFYPKDNTKGCTQEAKDFTESVDEFKEKGAANLGISPNTIKSHSNFVKKHQLQVTLISDTEKEALQKYQVWQTKKVCGRECMGVVRSTFLIDPEGKIAHVWENVKVKGHRDVVKDKLCDLA
jgi:peroxiredoxin Q/BCP